MMMIMINIGASAESIDLSTMPLEELTDLQKQVEARIEELSAADAGTTEEEAAPATDETAYTITGAPW